MFRIQFIILFLLIQPWLFQSHAKNINVAFGKDCEDLLLKNIKSAKSEIIGAVYSFSRTKIAKALVKKSKEGIDINLKLDRKQASYKYSRKAIKLIKSADISLDLVSMPKHYSMHHKFLVIDRETVLTGSYNFTTSASESNWENLVQIKDKMIAKKYIDEWKKIKSVKKKK